MNRPLRIALADDRDETRLYLRQLLPRLGHEVVAEAASGPELVQRCREARPDLVITDVLMPGLDGLAAAEEINREREVPVVAVSAYHDDEMLARAGRGCVVAYLVKPVGEADLKAAIALALPRFARRQALEREAAGLHHALEAHEEGERAKGAVSRRLGLSEGEALRTAEDIISQLDKI